MSHGQPPADRSIAEEMADRPDLTVQDEEKPARQLTGPVAIAVAVAAFVVAVFVLYEAFRPLPQGAKFYLILFLSGVLPLVSEFPLTLPMTFPLTEPMNLVAVRFPDRSSFMIGVPASHVCDEPVPPVAYQLKPPIPVP